MAKLTPREREVVRLLAAGKRQTEIAQLLCISRATVDAHLANARRKTDTASTVELAVRVALAQR